MAAIVAVGAGAVYFVALREDPQHDLPRLVILKNEGGEKPVVFRFDAPKRSRAMLVRMSTVSQATGLERKPILRVGGAPRPVVQYGQLPDYVLAPPVEAEGGRSTEFIVYPPVEETWRLRCQVALDDTGIRSLPTRVRWCWQLKSVSFWSLKVARWSGTIESETITNAAPRVAGSPAG